MRTPFLFTVIVHCVYSAYTHCVQGKDFVTSDKDEIKSVIQFWINFLKYNTATVEYYDYMCDYYSFYY